MARESRTSRVAPARRSTVSILLNPVILAIAAAVIITVILIEYNASQTRDELDRNSNIWNERYKARLDELK